MRSVSAVALVEEETVSSRRTRLSLASRCDTVSICATEAAATEGRRESSDGVSSYALFGGAFRL